jgi:N-acetylmuramoyl-L-alanine amidase
VYEQSTKVVEEFPAAGPLVKAQARLTGLGYYHGPIDGAYGSATALAVQQFQADNSLPVSGRLDLKTLASLGVSLQ